MVNEDISKGERQASQLGQPSAKLPLPHSLHQTQSLAYSTHSIDLTSPILDLLDRPGMELDALCPPLLGFDEVFFSIRFRTALQQRLKESTAMAEAYETLIQTVIAPHLIRQLTPSEAVALSEPIAHEPDWYSFEMLYQFPPSLRIHPANSTTFKRTHRDLEYGHQPGEINFWLPLTDTAPADRATMQIEDLITNEGVGAPYSPVRLTVGEIQMFYGTLRHHLVMPNNSPWTRVSLDFRVAPEKCFDANWRIPGLKIVHGQRRCTYRWRLGQS